jgi:hypothetical protein
MTTKNAATEKSYDGFTEEKPGRLTARPDCLPRSPRWAVPTARWPNESTP